MIVKRITVNDVDIIRNIELRRADYEEMKASTGLTDPAEALFLCVRNSEWTEVLIDESDKVVSIFGLGRNGTIGIPWMMAHPTLFTQYKKFANAYSKRVVAEMLASSSVLANYIDSRNWKHLEWVHRMGFEYDFEKSIYQNGVLFHFFYMEKN